MDSGSLDSSTSEGVVHVTDGWSLSVMEIALRGAPLGKGYRNEERGTIWKAKWASEANDTTGCSKLFRSGAIKRLPKPAGSNIDLDPERSSRPPKPTWNT